MKKWTPALMSDMSQKTVIVTGASSGIGMYAAKHFLEHGAHVIAAVRNVEKAKNVLPPSAEIRMLDLTSLDSIAKFADGIEEPIDILVNNAGVMAVPLSRTHDGFEMQLGTNHLGHFALTGHLIDQVTSRVVTVASTAHRMGKMRFDDINWSTGYRPWAAYGQSKLANLLFTSELQRRLTASGSQVKAVAAHPGYAATELQHHTQNKVQEVVMAFLNKTIAQSADAGSWPTLYAATESIPGDSFVGPDGFGEVRGHPTMASRSLSAQNDSDAMRLWEISEQLTKVKFPI